ncbi:MAG: NgoFVII family restriction endonuclease [Clostridia bacterium]|nr:NgoFVII family restriction endonuclease [Clostridia bacterium]
MLILNCDLAKRVLFDPLEQGANELFILSAYATPNMLSWYMKNIIDHKAAATIRIHLIVGMVPFDNLSVSVHEGFRQIVASQYPDGIGLIRCSYVTDKPAEHGNLFIWCNDGKPILAFEGSANFVQSSFVGNHRNEIMYECDPAEAKQYYESVEPRTIYCTHSEVEEYIILRPTHDVLDRECNLLREADDLVSVTLSLVTKTGEPGTRSGLNWGQRKGREPNQAYIHLPSKVAKSGFFPLEKQHFTAITDDHHQLTLRVEQQNNKAITTPVRNSDLGEYFRNRLGLANGAYVTRRDLDRYGRTDVKFMKLDEETFYMDFSVQ